MLGSQVAVNTPPATITLEFVWKGSRQYWAGQIRVVDLKIGEKGAYTVSLSELAASPDEVSLKLRAAKGGPYARIVQYLQVKNIDTIDSILLTAGIFNEKKGNVWTEKPDGTVERNTYFTRDDVPIGFSHPPVELGKHYKLVVSHVPDTRDDLTATLVEAGACKNIAVNTSAPSNTPSGFLPCNTAEGFEALRETLLREREEERKKAAGSKNNRMF